MSVTGSFNTIRIGSQLALGLAKAKVFGSESEAAARQYIMDALNSFGPGLPAKAAQLLGTENAEGSCNLSALIMGEGDVRSILAREAPALLQDLQWLSPKGSPGALGQVHQALLKSGAAVAIKIQYPEIDTRIHDQLSGLLGAASLAAKISFQSFDKQGYLNFFTEKLKEELDYAGEAQQQDRFHQRFIEQSDVIIPAVYREYSDSRVLTQDWVEFISFHRLSGLALEIRSEVAQILLETFLMQFLLHQELHGDFHLGNVGVLASNPGKLVLLDFGSILTLQANHVATFKEVIYCLRRGIDFDALEAFCSLGFERAAITPFAGDLRALWKVFFRPFCMSCAYDPSQWNFREDSAELLGIHRMAFRMAGPPWFLLFMKTLSGLTSCLRILAASIDTNCYVEKYLDFGPGMKSAFSTESAPIPAEAAKNLAKFLYIQVIENGEEKILLQMPSRAVENLEDLVPDDAKEQLRALGRDLTAMRISILASNLSPQVIFDENICGRSIRVWLQ